MLTETFVKEAIVVAQQLNAHGATLTAAPNSPVDQLNRTLDSTKSYFEGQLANTKEVEQRAIAIKDYVLNTTDTDLTSSVSGFLGVHTEVLDRLIEENKKGLIALARVSKEYVMPIVKDLFMQVKEGLEHNALGTSAQMRVETTSTPDLLVDASFKNLISAYSGVGINESLTGGAYLGPMQDQDIVALMRTGMSSMDNLAIQAATQNPNTLQDVWENVFLDFTLKAPTTSANTALSLKEFLYRTDNHVANLIVTFFIANSLCNGVPEGLMLVNSVSSDQGTVQAFKAKVAELRDTTGVMLLQLVKRSHAQLERNALVVEYQRDVVLVDRIAYKLFLERGGSNEMLLGGLFTKDRSYDLESILNNGSVLELVWEQNLGLLLERDRNNANSYRRRLASEVFERQLKDALSQDESSIDLSSMLRSFSNTYDKLSLDELEQFYIASVKLVCRSRFPDPAFEAILLNMYFIMQDQPELSIDNVASLAFARHVAGWLADQIVITINR